MTTPNDPTMSHSSLDAVIAAYMLHVEGGEVPNRQELLDRHPEHTSALIAFFSDLDRMDRVASPLRLAGGPDATNEIEVNGRSGLPTVRYFGDYELLEEIARGGMGVVYKARQTSLNRLVALKMILRGRFATEKDVARFRAEAESAANLDHPHIVPIHEIGDHEGQQYFSMKYVEGTSLAKHPRGDTRTEVAGLIDVIRAVHYAHQHGVLHRDLKPANVLVDPRGTRFVTDFGLAKRLSDTDRSLTDPGQILGTPRYMAPEQAAGRRDLTISADVYSLGVILYERLTGQTPFTGDNLLTLLRQVRESEAPRPSSILPGLDRDLETVVLKCLDKDPLRRYVSAEALADDLANWLAGRPITARPVGQAERAWRWCKRNPIISGLAGAVAASLLIGIIVSTYFAFAERRERTRAISAEKNMEGSLARGLAKSLDPDGEGKATLSVPESENLWELAGLGNTDIYLRFLDEATRDTVSLSQLRARSEPAFIAAVGLDPEKRDRAYRLLSAKLRDPTLPLRRKAELALVTLELEDRSEALTNNYFEVVAQSLTTNFPNDLKATVRRRGRKGEDVRFVPDRLLSVWGQHLIDASARLDPNTLARLITAHMEQETDDQIRGQLAECLVSVSTKMDPDEAARVCSLAARSLVDATDRDELVMKVEVPGTQVFRSIGSSPSGLSIMIGRINSKEATPLAQVLLRAMEVTASARSSLAVNLVATTEKMATSDAARSLESALDLKSLDPETLYIILEGLVAVTKKMEPDDAGRLCDKIAQRLTAVVETNGDHTGPEYLAAFGKLLKLNDLSKVWRPAIRVLERSFEKLKDAGVRGDVAWGLAPLAECLGPDEAARICGSRAEELEAMLKRETTQLGRVSIIRGLAATVLRLAPDRAEQVVRVLATRAQRERDHKPGSENETDSVPYVFYHITRHLDTGDAAQAARVIVAALEREKDASVRFWLLVGLGLVTEKMEPSAAARICGPVAKEMAEALVTKNDKHYFLADGLAVFASQLDPAYAKPVIRVLVDAFERETDATARQKLTRALSPLADRLDQGQTTRILDKFVTEIIAELKVDPRAEMVNRQSEVLLSVGSRMEPAEANRIRGQVVLAIASQLENEEEAASHSRLVSALASVWCRIEPAKAVPILTDLLNREKEHWSRANLIRALVSVSGRMPPAESLRVLTAAFEHEGNQDLRKTLAEAIASRMEPPEADRICSRVIQSLLKRSHVSTEADRQSWGYYYACPPSLLPWLDPEKAHALAWESAEGLCSTSHINGDGIDSDYGVDSASLLLQLLSDTNRAEISLRAAMMTMSIGRALGSGFSTTMLAPNPFPCRLTTQELVELLKMPTCFGSARRVVLDQLGNRYGQNFVNHWAFVRYAPEHGLKLDFTTPPRRPNPEESLKRMLDILDGSPAGRSST